MFKKIIFGTLLLGVLSNIYSQKKIEYTVIKDDAEWEKIPNLFISPMLFLDAPIYGAGGLDAMEASSLGWGIRSHAIVKGKYFVDINYMGGLWNVVSDIDKKAMQLQIGGAILTKSSVKQKDIKVVLERKEVKREAVTFENKVKVTEEINYVSVPGKELNFFGYRGGLYYFRSIFEYDQRDQQPNTPFFLNYDVNGYSQAYGIYGGITWGKATNLHIQLKDGRKRSEMIYNRWYADVIIAPYRNTMIESSPNNLTINGLPFGFRIGIDHTNRTTKGVAGKIINAEVGYRPGLNGFYTTIGLSFLQVRAKVGAF